MCRRQNKADEHDGKEDIPQAEERHGQCDPAAWCPRSHKRLLACDGRQLEGENRGHVQP